MEKAPSLCLTTLCKNKKSGLHSEIHFLKISGVRLEHLWLVVMLWSLSWTLTAWSAWASVITAWTSVASAVIAAWATVTLLTTWTSVSAWLALWLNVSLWLLEESLAGKSHLAALLVDLEELYVYLVTYMKNILYLLSLLPSDL